MIIVPNICTMCWNFQSEREYSIRIIEIDSQVLRDCVKIPAQTFTSCGSLKSCLTSLGLIFLSFKEMWILRNPNHLVALEKKNEFMSLKHFK